MAIFSQFLRVTLEAQQQIVFSTDSKLFHTYLHQKSKKVHRTFGLSYRRCEVSIQINLDCFLVFSPTFRQLSNPLVCTANVYTLSIFYKQHS